MVNQIPKFPILDYLGTSNTITLFFFRFRLYEKGRLGMPYITLFFFRFTLYQKGSESELFFNNCQTFHGV